VRRVGKVGDNSAMTWTLLELSPDEVPVTVIRWTVNPVTKGVQATADRHDLETLRAEAVALVQDCAQRASDLALGDEHLSELAARDRRRGAVLEWRPRVVSVLETARRPSEM
jgi:hypothetical protein